MGWILGVAVASLLAWVVLVVGWGGYWLPRPKLDGVGTRPKPGEDAPSVVAVIPARNEEDILDHTLPTVMNQVYAGRLHAVLVDDRSDDGTFDVATQIAGQGDLPHRLKVLEGRPLPSGWAGKVWAMEQGVRWAEQIEAEYVWLTDADIQHDPNVLSMLVDKAEEEELDLVSVMAQLKVDSRWSQLLIPAFVYFFSKLYPFRFVNDPRRTMAGAAGGCVLLRANTLRASGGLHSIRGALIDDCALGRLIKRQGGGLWLGYASGVRSARSYTTLRSIWDMVARSAFHQLHYSWRLLGGTILGMLLLYAVPPLMAVAGTVLAVQRVSGAAWLAAAGWGAWGLLSASFIPLLHHLASTRWMAPLLPVAGVLYTAMTICSAYRHVTGRSGLWKGRAYAAGSSSG